MTRTHGGKRSALLLGLVLLALGCDSGTGPDEERVVGIIAGVNPDDPYIVAPDTVQAGETFTVTIRTYGLDTCVRKGETEVDAEDDGAVITPYDKIIEEGTGCADEIQVFEHTAMLDLNEAGPALVYVVGRKAPEEIRILVPVSVIVRE